MNKLVKSLLLVISLFASGSNTFSGYQKELDKLSSRIGALKSPINLIFIEEFKELKNLFPKIHFFSPSDSVFQEMTEDLHHQIVYFNYFDDEVFFDEVFFKEKYKEISLLLKKAELKIKIDSLPAAKNLHRKLAIKASQQGKLLLQASENEIQRLTINPPIFRDGGRAVERRIESLSEMDFDNIIKDSLELRRMQEEMEREIEELPEVIRLREEFSSEETDTNSNSN
jgi:hypothetical protein